MYQIINRLYQLNENIQEGGEIMKSTRVQIDFFFFTIHQ